MCVKVDDPDLSGCSRRQSLVKATDVRVETPAPEDLLGLIDELVQVAVLHIQRDDHRAAGSTKCCETLEVFREHCVICHLSNKHIGLMHCVDGEGSERAAANTIYARRVNEMDFA